MKFPTIITPSLLQSLKSQLHLPKHTWYIVSSVALSALNRPDEIKLVFQDAILSSTAAAAVADGEVAERNSIHHEGQLRIARRMREGLVKSAAVVGVPRTINALMALKTVTPEDLLDLPSSPSPTSRGTDAYDKPPIEIIERGERFFNKIYGKIAKRIMGQMDRSGTEDLGIVARLVYGHLLSNVQILSAAETSLVLIAALIPQDVNPQLKGHLRGAVNNGAAIEEVKAVRQSVIDICQAAGMTMLHGHHLGGYGWSEDVADL